MAKRYGGSAVRSCGRFASDIKVLTRYLQTTILAYQEQAILKNTEQSKQTEKKNHHQTLMVNLSPIQFLKKSQLQTQTHLTLHSAFRVSFVFHCASLQAHKQNSCWVMVTVGVLYLFPSQKGTEKNNVVIKSYFVFTFIFQNPPRLGWWRTLSYNFGTEGFLHVLQTPTEIVLYRTAGK